DARRTGAAVDGGPVDHLALAEPAVIVAPLVNGEGAVPRRGSQEVPPLAGLHHDGQSAAAGGEVPAAAGPVDLLAADRAGTGFGGIADHAGARLTHEESPGLVVGHARPARSLERPAPHRPGVDEAPLVEE